MIRTLYYMPDNPLRLNPDPGEFPQLIQQSESLLWIDFVSESPESCEPILRSFGFHPLAIDDALQETHTPKVDDWGTYLYIVLNTVVLQDDNQQLTPITNELDVFLGENFIVTHHDQPIASLDETWNACQRDPRHVQNGADHLLYKLIDNLVTKYMFLAEQVDKEIDQIEDQIFDDPNPKMLEKLFSLKRILLAMRRIILPQREVLNKMARDDYTVIDAKDRIFFRDIYDHLVRMHDLNESMRDLVSSALDTYLSVINNRMNEVMKTLTIITTLFMPISFLTGFFGMNFFEPVARLTGWTARSVFLLVLAGFLCIPILMYTWMRRRTWI